MLVLHGRDPISLPTQRLLRNADVVAGYSELHVLERFHVPFVCFDDRPRPIYISARGLSVLGTRREGRAVLLGIARAVADARAAGAEAPGAVPLMVPALAQRAICTLRWCDLAGSAPLAVVVLHPWDGTPSRVAMEQPLTPREREVARLIADGATTRHIATMLAISVHTARRHTERVFQKCGVKCRASLAALYVQALAAS